MKSVQMPLGCLAIVLIAACGSVPGAEVTRSQEIATDLPDDGGTQAIFNYWVDAGKILRGECSAEKVLVPSACREKVQSMDYAVFKAALEQGLGAELEAVKNELQTNGAALIAMGSLLADLRAKLADEETKLGVAKDDYAKLNAEFSRLEALLAEYKDQVGKIDSELVRRDDSDLREQAGELAAELKKLAEKSSQMARELSFAAGRVSAASEKVDAVRQSMRPLEIRLENLRRDEERMRTRVEVLSVELERYRDTLSKLESGIVYRFLRDSRGWKDNRHLVKRFDAIFGAKLAPSQDAATPSQNGVAPTQNLPEHVPAQK